MNEKTDCCNNNNIKVYFLLSITFVNEKNERINNQIGNVVTNNLNCFLQKKRVLHSLKDRGVRFHSFAASFENVGEVILSWFGSHVSFDVRLDLKNM